MPQDAVFRTVAAVLHLGNVTFVDAGDEAAAVEGGAEEHLEGEWGGAGWMHRIAACGQLVCS